MLYVTKNIRKKNSNNRSSLALRTHPYDFDSICAHVEPLPPNPRIVEDLAREDRAISLTFSERAYRLAILNTIPSELAGLPCICGTFGFWFLRNTTPWLEGSEKVIHTSNVFMPFMNNPITRDAYILARRCEERSAPEEIPEYIRRHITFPFGSVISSIAEAYNKNKPKKGPVRIKDYMQDAKTKFEINFSNFTME